MNITVTGMTKIDDLNSKLAGKRFQSGNQCRNTGYRHDDIFIDLLRGHGA